MNFRYRSIDHADKIGVIHFAPLLAAPMALAALPPCDETTMKQRFYNPYYRRVSGRAKFGLLMLLALVATSAGVGYRQWQQSLLPPSLDQIQANMENALIFPDDYQTLPAFNLLNQDGQQVSEQSFDDRWSMLFFGFTQCPDICPVTLAVLRDASTLIKDQATQSTPFDIVFFSVDPQRDPPEVIKPYVESFGGNTRGLTGDLNAVLEFAQAMNIVVSYDADPDDPTYYTVDHTASILLIDPEKRIRAKFNLPHEPDMIASDYLQIRKAL